MKHSDEPGKLPLPPIADQGRLVPIVTDTVWHAEQTLRFGPLRLATRMTVIRLADGGLWVHSPITPTSALDHDLRRIGPVCHVVAPNRSHHLFFRAFLDAYPSAQGWIAPSLVAKRPDLAEFRRLSEPAPWTEELPQFFIAGLPIIDEFVWFHLASGTLVLTDLLFCIRADASQLLRAAARLLGVYRRPAMSRTMKLAVRDRSALRTSVAPLLALPVQRVIVAHDSVNCHDARGNLQRAFDWL